MQEIQYKELLNNSFDLIWALDLDGIFTYCSDNVLQYSGYTKEELLGSSISRYISFKDIERFEKVFKQAIKDKNKIINFEHYFTRKDTTTIVVLINAIPIFDKNGEVTCFQGTSKDITREKEAGLFLENLNETLKQKVKRESKKIEEKEQQLIQQSRLAQIGEMISMIAHQWRQPLGAISATAINIQLQVELDTYKLSNKEKFCSFLSNELVNINDYVQNLTTTIDDFRNFYKPNKHVVSSTLENVCDKSLNIIKASLVSDNINVICEYNSNQDLKMYENEMMQVILNILQNSHDHLKEKKIEKPYILIKTKEKTLEIYDNAGGIKGDIIDNIFDPYFSTKLKKNGTGLGLYMSKTIVEEHHNGILSVENTYNGACFKITLF